MSKKMDPEKVEKLSLLDFILIQYYSYVKAKEVWSTAEKVLIEKGLLRRK